MHAQKRVLLHKVVVLLDIAKAGVYIIQIIDIFASFSPKIVAKFFVSKSVSGYFKTKKKEKEKVPNGH